MKTSVPSVHCTVLFMIVSMIFSMRIQRPGLINMASIFLDTLRSLTASWGNDSGMENRFMSLDHDGSRWLLTSRVQPTPMDCMSIHSCDLGIDPVLALTTSQQTIGRGVFLLD
jgi:hypothetical protein